MSGEDLEGDMDDEVDLGDTDEIFFDGEDEGYSHDDGLTSFVDDEDDVDDLGGLDDE